LRRNTSELIEGNLFKFFDFFSTQDLTFTTVDDRFAGEKTHKQVIPHVE
jgi:hypothetical protein